MPAAEMPGATHGVAVVSASQIMVMKAVARRPMNRRSPRVVIIGRNPRRGTAGESASQTPMPISTAKIAAKNTQLLASPACCSVRPLAFWKYSIAKVLRKVATKVALDEVELPLTIDADGLVHSAVNDPNRYSGPGTGYRLEGERWQLLQSLPQVVDPFELAGGEPPGEPVVTERGEAVLSYVRWGMVRKSSEAAEVGEQATPQLSSAVAAGSAGTGKNFGSGFSGILSASRQRFSSIIR